MESKYHAFYVDLPHKDFSENCKRVTEHYSVSKYLITAEKTSKGVEHYHFLIHCTQNTYAAIMGWFKSQYGLIGKADKDGRRQYGKLKRIRNIDQLKIYMMKDWDEYKLLHTNIDKKEIENLFALSKKKSDRMDRLEILKSQFRETLEKNIKSEITEYEDYDTVVSVHIKRILCKTACSVWIDDERPPLFRTLLCYGRKVLGENTFMYLYYSSVLK